MYLQLHLRCKHSFSSRNIYTDFNTGFPRTSHPKSHIAINPIGIMRFFCTLHRAFSELLCRKARHDGALKSWHDNFIYLSSRFYPVLSSAPAEVRPTHWVGHFFCLFNDFLFLSSPPSGYPPASSARPPSAMQYHRRLADDRLFPVFLPETDNVGHRNFRKPT